jgi:3'-5' exonuclease
MENAISLLVVLLEVHRNRSNKLPCTLMATLILDIETVGEQWDDIDDITKTTLTRWIERSATDEAERVMRTRDIEERLGFSPFTGFIVALGICDRERARSTVYYVGDGSGGEISEGPVMYKERSEKALLEEFWDGVQSYDTLVTFNGRSFDVPFILHRSVACGVMPTRDFLARRYLTQQKPPYHIDLCDEVSFYGALSRRPSLHLVCRAYGIPSPKTDVSGDEVAALYAAGQYLTIATYNAKDLDATRAVYEKWLEFLAPREFVQSIDY